jgi:serine/threonine protein kinase
MSYPERHYLYSGDAPAIVEALLIPFHCEGKPVGTIWIIAHDETRKFDAEDHRLMSNLARFAATAYQLLAAQELRTALAVQRAREDQLERANAELLKLVRTGQPLGQYALLEKVGQGGMGAVYKAMHTLLMRVVALKVLSAERTRSTEVVARFLREMQATGRLNHPNIVQALDAREVNGIHFLVMEFVEGINLAEVSRRLGPLPVPDCAEVIRQAALGLQHAHEHGLIHRDVKPSNLMLTPAGHVKVLDLGLAWLAGEPADPGCVAGTPDYMAPEQASGSPPDIRADIYCLGCTLYHLLLGHAPFSGSQFSTAVDKLLAHARRPVPPVQDFRPEVPDGLVCVLDRLMAKEPAHRFNTPAAVAAALGPFTAGADLPGLFLQAEAQKEGPPGGLDSSAGGLPTTIAE